MTETAAPRTQTPDRRFWTPLRIALVVLMLPAINFAAPRLFSDQPDTPPAEAIAPLRDAALQIVQRNELARDDGAVYAVDVTQLATYAALAGDRELYDPLRDIILNKLLIRRVEGDPAHGMVAWRHMPEPPHHDASGTTEALRAAEALYAGVQAFGLTEDRAAIKLIVDAYCRHATPPGETPWMIRNYFNLHPEVYNFITNSFLVDYDPDLLTVLAEDFDEPEWADVTEKSAALIDKAVTPAGLLHQMIRPEVGTIMPHYAAEGIYSANGVEQLSNVLTVAERSNTTNPAVARRVVDFCRKRLHNLRLYYDADTGRRLRGNNDTWAGVETWGPLLRLSIELDEPSIQREALRNVIHLSSGFPEYEGQDRLYLLGEALLALQYAVRASDERNPSP
ncbi:MAG: hypothetical protein AAF333_17220 [Planctomycetota bacterium]